ncbi:MAG: DUF3833 family protein [Sphingomicrobium sp.]|nr:DUF3833 domain-containing protein [Sphingomonadales bacterium]
MRILFLPLALAACSADPSDSAPIGGPQLDPVAFFTGHAEGRAMLHKLMGKSETVLVHSDGRADGHGGVILDQRIEEQGKAPRTRSWHLVPAGRDRFTGTLTDATGPVTAAVTGPRLDIRYPMKGGLQADQTLTLRADGRTLDNRLTVTKFGVRLARLDEVITKGN